MLDTLPLELMLIVCKHLLNCAHSLPQQWPSREASASLAQLARVAPSCYVPAMTTAVRYANLFCLVKPNPDLPGAWIVINERLLCTHDLAVCIDLDLLAPRATDKHGVARPPMYLVVGGSFKDGIPARMAIPVPAMTIRYMKVVFSTWLFDYVVPPHLTALTLEGCRLEMFHVKLLATHLPPTLRRLWLDAIQINSRDLGTLLRQIPAGVRDLAIVDMHLDD
ncbi:hypothetical protein AMAG_05743 [Allomyces macrogynus ATCC 38327]|uniref:Uncharacterized protein n=1 Tax=Allomyces macrogynus (strain ATCC 38327) TaxID=578462 RepID=A0A0L0SCZ0_ALLM3|nr:hypothetical protein AMAG_05743 [Allomyces macrogynus ATCC 38327]|eukprot:KNE60346.1 hypothetical protein AMAG_05743 [Allomyces macrogynus ATCC 38327]